MTQGDIKAPPHDTNAICLTNHLEGQCCVGRESDEYVIPPYGTQFLKKSNPCTFHGDLHM